MPSSECNSSRRQGNILRAGGVRSGKRLVLLMEATQIIVCLASQVSHAPSLRFACLNPLQGSVMSIFSQRHSLWFTLFLTLATVTPLGQAADPPQPKSILVRGKVTAFDDDIDRHQFAFPATIEITHVYRGNGKLVGKTFTVHYSPLGGGGSGRNPLDKRYKVGEEGVWQLEEYQDKLYNSRFAARKSVDPDFYGRAVAWVEAVEKYAKASPKERTELAPKLVRSDSFLIAKWMLETLDEERTADADALLTQLISTVRELPMWTQAELDDLLCRSKRLDWLQSDERRGMQSHWVTGKTGADAGKILGAIESGVARGYVEKLHAIKLLKLATGNKDWSETDRAETFKRIGLIAGKLDDEVADAWLFDVMRTHADVAHRRAAARAIYFLPLYSTRLQAVETHLLKETDKEIKATLEAAVKKAKEMK